MIPTQSILLTSSIVILTLMTFMTAAIEASNQQSSSSCQEKSTDDKGTCNPLNPSRAPPQIVSKGSFTVLNQSSFREIPSYTRDALLDDDINSPTFAKPTARPYHHHHFY